VAQMPIMPRVGEDVDEGVLRIFAAARMCASLTVRLLPRLGRTQRRRFHRR
jgi:hypothetical protein